MLHIIMPHRSTTYIHAAYYAIVTDRVAWSVGLSVALLVCHTSEPYKMAKAIELPFAFRTQVDPMNNVLHVVQIPLGKGQF